MTIAWTGLPRQKQLPSSHEVKFVPILSETLPPLPKPNHSTKVCHCNQSVAYSVPIEERVGTVATSPLISPSCKICIQGLAESLSVSCPYGGDARQQLLLVCCELGNHGNCKATVIPPAILHVTRHRLNSPSDQHSQMGTLILLSECHLEFHPIRGSDPSGWGTAPHSRRVSRRETRRAPHSARAGRPPPCPSALKS